MAEFIIPSDEDVYTQDSAPLDPGDLVVIPGGVEVEFNDADVITGWDASSNYFTYTSGGTVVPTPGMTLTGVTSGHTAVCVAVVTNSGSWAAGSAVGKIWIKSKTAAFHDGEKISYTGTSDGCTVNTATSATSDPTVVVDTSEMAEGTGSIKVTLNSADNQLLIMCTSGATNFTSKLAFLSSVKTTLTARVLTFGFGENTVTSIYADTITTSNDWKQITANISAVADADKDAIIYAAWWFTGISYNIGKIMWIDYAYAPSESQAELWANLEGDPCQIYPVTIGVGSEVEAVQDVVGGMVSSNTETGIAVTYDDINGKLNFAVAAVKLDDAAAPDNNTDLDATTSAHGLLLKATAPAAGLLNVVGIANAETSYSLKAMFDITNPAALGTAGPGTQIIAARRDHIHTLPKLDDMAAPDNNTDLNSTTTAHGLLLTAVAPAAGLLSVVGIANAETSYALKAIFDTTNPANLGSVGPGTQVIAARRDHIHATEVEDAAYGAGWDGDQTHAPSQNAVYDKINAMVIPTTEELEDIVGSMVDVAGSTQVGISVEYDDANSAIDFTIDDSYIYDLVGGMIDSNVELNIGVTYDSDAHKINFDAIASSQTNMVMVPAAATLEINDCDTITDIDCAQGYFAFTSGGTHEPVIGDTITGSVSGHTAIYVGSISIAGSWAAGTASGLCFVKSYPESFHINDVLSYPGTADGMTPSETTYSASADPAGAIDGADFAEGTGSYRATPSVLGHGMCVNIKVAAKNLTGYGAIKAWVKSEGGITSRTIYMAMGETDCCVLRSSIQTVIKDEWTEITWDISSIPSASKNAITNFMIYFFSNNFSSTSAQFLVDYVRAPGSSGAVASLWSDLFTTPVQVFPTLLAEATEISAVQDIIDDYVPRILVLSKAADETVNNSAVLQADDHLTFSIGANEVWSFELMLIITSGVTPDFKIGWTYPNGCLMFWGGSTKFTAMDVAVGSSPDAAFIESAVFARGTVSSDKFLIKLNGIIHNGGTAGTFGLMWAQDTKTASDTTVCAHSHMILTQLPS